MHDGNRKAHAHVAVQAHLDVVYAEGFDFDPAEEVDICCAPFYLAQFEADSCLGHDGVVRVEDSRVLLKCTDTTAPTGPKAELKEPDGNLRCGNGADDTDEGLGPADFGAHVLAKHG